ncbi:metallophosphoesterase family protein [Ruegeria halocynthiae]|uniref:metallophosphoesterase family protein n=1 Tax=Ruegeria halocynthiae TaxID=985054 RepID=UPI000560EC25|nr:metallophosphoesterase family protein [Ruegeria halocynthiae]
MIGDVHGCIVQLEKLLHQVPQGFRTILVGDYIDRGEHSAEVLQLLSSHNDLTCLMGNHEEMLLQFLRDPERHGARWVRYGGLQTLASFGIRGARPEMAGTELKDARDRLRDTMGETLCVWLKQLGRSEISGNVLVTHAGADPNLSPDQQPDETLTWGHPQFRTADRKDGAWVVHGHTIVDVATARRGRISIDTGAYATGTLSAVCLTGAEPTFLTARV